MTARQVFEAMLTELSKVNAPSLLLHEFNYYFNKAINQYINKRYSIYDTNQQTTDDLRVLKATAILDPEKTTAYGQDLNNMGAGLSKLFGGTWEVNLPDDYLHMLNCSCIYELNKDNRCYNKGDYVQFSATRLTADAWSIIQNDYYNRPLPERPYFYIHNVNTSTELPTNIESTDMYEEYNISTNGENNVNPVGNSNFSRTISLKNGNQSRKISTVEKEIAQRYGNASKVRCEIRYGNDSSIYVLKKVLIDYIKAPQTIRLTKAQVDLTEDTSQIMEFPDYVCQEIINELVILVMQRTADPRLQTQQAVTQSIASPAQQQTPQPQQQQRRG